jgi:hypothetical protein
VGRGTVKIANGASQSDAIDITDQAIVGIAIPAGWTAADITFLAASHDAGAYQPVYDQAGTELKITTGGAARYFALDGIKFRFRLVKLRSGTAAAAVNQGAERIIEVLFAPPGV